MAVRALLLTTNSSHCGLGEAERAVMISTLCPLTKRVRNGTSFLSTREATARLPTSVCTA
ncbi:hypothetical protein D3C81_1141650 [compost metagenome]